MNTKLYREQVDYEQTDIGELRKRLKTAAPLETFAFEQLSPGDHWVTISSPEFTAICPFSDLPDFGSVTINYIPGDRCLELKSFKLYIHAFRAEKVFHETVTEVIFADFIAAVNPVKANITVDMNVRGNVKTICQKSFG